MEGSLSKASKNDAKLARRLSQSASHTRFEYKEGFFMTRRATCLIRGSHKFARVSLLTVLYDLPGIFHDIRTPSLTVLCF